jgi:hypothetical protein
MLRERQGGAPASAGVRFFGRLILGGWLLVTSVGGATLLGRHLIPLPATAAAGPNMAALLALRGPDEADQLTAYHVLYAECRCSQRIAEHLVMRARPKGVVEHVLVVGREDALTRKLEASGYRVHPVAPADLLPTYGVEAAPLFVVASRTGTLLYAGGYTARKQGFDVQDVTILRAALASRTTEPLPVYGCAVSERLAKSLNPVSLP